MKSVDALWDLALDRLDGLPLGSNSAGLDADDRYTVETFVQVMQIAEAHGVSRSRLSSSLSVARRRVDHQIARESRPAATGLLQTPLKAVP
ncbi:MAG: hypothetical protein NVS9B4_00500 [Candidatus Acidiferrum sp.]